MAAILTHFEIFHHINIGMVHLHAEFHDRYLSSVLNINFENTFRQMDAKLHISRSTIRGTLLTYFDVPEPTYFRSIAAHFKVSDLGDHVNS